MKRIIKILRVCAIASLVLAALKLGGFTFRINGVTIFDFTALSWHWVALPVALPVGMLITTAITIVALFYHHKNFKK